MIATNPYLRASLLSIGALLATPDGARAEADADPQEVSASEIVVLGARGKAYNVGELTTATRTGTDIMDVPQSIQFVPRDVIDDQQIVDLISALRNVSGSRPAPMRATDRKASRSAASDRLITRSTASC